jgi:predicted HAD superfamily Cof-like phosphohydrolase
MYQQNREDYVRQFQRLMGQDVGVKNPTSTLLEFRYNLLLEELKELGEEVAIAMAESNFKTGIPLKVKARMLKEMADVQYVLSGMAVTLGLPLEEAFVRVHKSNLSKLGDDGKPLYREDGKVQKGPNYLPPDMETLLEGII